MGDNLHCRYSILRFPLVLCAELDPVRAVEMSPLYVAMLVLSLLEGVVSIYLNLGIVLVYLRSWVKGVKLNPSSLIHLIMATNNFTMRCSRIADDLCLWLPEIFCSEYNSIMIILLEFHLYFNYWLTVCLCAYYCLSISNFSHRLIVSMKRNLLAYLPHMIFLTGVGSLVLGFLRYLSEIDNWKRHSMNRTKIFRFSLDNDMASLCGYLSASLGSAFPFTGIVFFLLATVIVLFKHIQNIGQTGPHVHVHIAVIKTMVMFFLVSALNFTSSWIHIIKKEPEKSLVKIVTWYIVALFPTMEAVIIIHASPKLKNIIPRCLRHGVY